MALTCWPLLLLFLFLNSCSARLTREQKQLLLELHNDARRSQGIPYMRQMVWNSSLAAAAQSSSRECTTQPASQKLLMKAVSGMFSWTGQNQHIHPITAKDVSIANSVLRKVFSCWLSGTSPCSESHRAQVLHPQSFLFGCGARIFARTDRCHAITSGVKVVCFYAPGYVAGAGMILRNRCPPAAPILINKLCSSMNKAPTVPVDPVDPPVTTTMPIVYGMNPCYVSFGGGNLVTIYGRGFAADQFNDKNPNLGNKVIFYNEFKNFSCDVVTYDSSTEKIVCRTQPHPNAADFKLQVFVDAILVERIKACTLKYREWVSPTITSTTPSAGVSPLVLALKGRIFASKVSATQEVDDVASTQMLKRLSVGGEACDPQNETDYYGGSVNSYGVGKVFCRLVSTRIASMNATVVLSKYGNSYIPVERYSIDNRLRRYLFQTHSDIIGVEPNSGSPTGGTRITIYGRNFYPDGPLAIKAYISGVPCKVISYTPNEIECITGRAPLEAALYEGSRGVLREVWQTSYTADLDVTEGRPIGCFEGSSNCSIEESIQSTQEDQPRFGELFNFNQRYLGFLRSSLNSYYSFNINADDGARLYFSPNASPEAKKLIAFVNKYSKTWNSYPSQISEPIYLEAGKSYYIEVLHHQGRGNWKIGFGAKIHNLSWTSDVGVVDYEEQEIMINSTIDKELQEVTIKSRPVIQLIQCKTSGDSFPFYLSVNGNITQELLSSDNASTIEQALNDLEEIQRIGKVSVMLNITGNTMDLFVIIASNHENLPSIKVLNCTNASTSVVQKLWLPKNFSLSFNTSRKTNVLSTNISADNLLLELKNLFSIICDISSTGSVFFRDSYDVAGIKRFQSYGTLVNNREPYCGSYSIKNPTVLWRERYTRDERTNVPLGVLTITKFGQKYVCFASNGPIPRFRLRVTVLIRSKPVTYNIPLTPTPSSSRWSYQCTDLYQGLNEQVEQSQRFYQVSQIFFYKSTTDFWIDEPSISRSKPNVIQVEQAVRPNGIFVKYVDVHKVNLIRPSLHCRNESDPFSCYMFRCIYTIKFTVHDCGSNMTLLRGFPSSVLKVDRLRFGTPPVGGTFDLSFEGRSIRNIPAVYNGTQLNKLLDDYLPNEGPFNVIQTKSCSSPSWVIRWTQRGGDRPLMKANGTHLNGSNVSIAVMTRVHGGTWLRPFRGDMLSVPYQNPQVQVVINSIPSSCRSQNCSFTFTNDSVSVVFSVSPLIGGQDGNPITISGSNFPDNSANVTVTIGNQSCNIQSINSSTITCIPEPGVAGVHDVKVLTGDIGYASSDGINFQYILQVDSLEPNRGSIGGSNLITFSGIGFPQMEQNSTLLSESFHILFDEYPCLVVSSNLTSLSCLTQPHEAGNVNVTIVVNGVKTILPNSYQYSTDSTTVIHMVVPVFGPASGGTMLFIVGNGFVAADDFAVTIGGANCSVQSSAGTQFACETSSNSPGVYDIIVRSVSTFGRAVLSSLLNQPDKITQNSKTLWELLNASYNGTAAAMIPFTYVFGVSSISPSSGSVFGGTVLTIKGSGFVGNVTLTDNKGAPFCHEISFTNDEINCTTKSTQQDHIISNNGTNQSLGLHFAWSPSVLSITLGDTVTWQWIGSTLRVPRKFEVHQLPNGFKSLPRVDGNFSYTFTQPGKYSYGTDISDLCLTCSMTGIINVRPLETIQTGFSVVLNNTGIEALYNLTGNDDGSSNDTCFVSSPMNDSPSFLYSACKTPIVSSVDMENSTVHSTIMLNGTGFAGSSVVANFGNYPCILSYNDDDLIICQLSVFSEPPPFTPLPLTLLVSNRGYAAINTDVVEASVLLIRPVVTSITPSNGSLLGGNIVAIHGASFLNTSRLRVFLGRRKCFIKRVSYHTMEVVIPPANNTNATSVTENFNITYGQGKEALCDIEGGCSYRYLQESTPVVGTVQPMDLNSTNITVITLTGSLLSSDSVVTIGGVACVNVTKVNSGDIACLVYPVEAGEYNISVLVPGYGYAKGIKDTNIRSSLIIDSISPVNGSIRGGTLVTVSGIGFSNISTHNYVSINNVECPINATTSYITIQCITPDLNQEGIFNLIVTVRSTLPQRNKRAKRSVQASIAFQYSSLSTPHISSISPSSGQSGDEVVIYGQLLSSNASVSIGSAPCIITSGNDTAISCILGASYVGTHPIEVSIPSLGQANGDLLFHYNLQVDSLDPVEGSFAGHNTLTLTGVGFDPTATFISICNESCFYSDDQPTLTGISCIVPSLSHLLTSTIDALNCTVVINSVNTTSVLSYTLRRNLTSFVTSINRTRGGTAGGSLLHINGSGFSGSSVNVTIAGVECSVNEYAESYIICETGASGQTLRARVMVYVEGKGFAVSSVEFYYVDLWSSPYTWGGGPLPIEGDFVIVPSGQRLVLDVRTPILKILLIQGGELVFDDEDNGVELHSENILITDGGKLEVGTEESPYKHKAQIVMYGHRQSTELPLFGAKTLAVRNGTLDLHGTPIRDTWTCITKTVRPGENLLRVKHNISDWEIGGKIVIASTSYSQRENEELTIESIGSDGYSITVSPPLRYTHVSLIQVIRGRTIETCAEVGYLTRNVVVRGNRNKEWDVQFEDCSDDFRPGQFEVQTCFGGRFGAEAIGDEFGSQIMLHRGPRDRVIGRIEYIEVTQAGQAYRLGRYPIHFHLNGDVSDSYVRGCGIHGTFNRAVTIHGVHYLLVEKNVAYNIKGHAFFLEDGIEIGNVVQYNLAVFVKASSSLLNVDITPAAYWSVNPNNTFRHNAAAGGTHFGFWYRLPKNPTGPSFTTSVEPVHAPMGLFYNNTAHSFGWYGIWIFVSYYPVRADTCRAVVPAVFEGFLAWRNDRGVEFSEVGAVQLKHSIMLDNAVAGVEYTDVKSAWDKNGALIEDILIIAHSALRYEDDVGLEVCTGAGIKTPPSNYLTVSNVTFVNFNETRCCALRACSHCRNKQGGFETRFEKLAFDSSPNVACWKWEHEQVFRDMDGTLTGIPGGALLPTTNVLPSSHCGHHANSSIGSVPGSICDETVGFVRFALTDPKPSSLRYRELTVSSDHGEVILEYVKKRLTLGSGYMAILPTKNIYELNWAGGKRFTNISYLSLYSAFNYNDYLWIKHNFSQSIDVAKINNRIRTMSPVLPPGGLSALGDWYTEENETLLTYYVNGTNPFCAVDTKVSFLTYYCFYENCIVPTPPPPINITIGRPNVTNIWSNASIWPNGVLPLIDSNVYIPCNLYVLVDVPLPRMNRLIICGGLEFMDDRDHVLEAYMILIDGGQLVAGTSNTSFKHQLIIVLLGDLSSLVYRMPNFGPVVGAKALGVFGYLGLHGQERNVSWTLLAKTANAGQTELVLTWPVDWRPGEEIVIASTHFEATQAEELIIVNVSENRKIIKVNRPLTYTHIGGVTGTGNCAYSVSAEVGLLSRNIKILGTHPNSTQDKAEEESYGCRVLISSYFNSTRGQQFTGSATLSGVQFKGCGQEGFYDAYDPRYSLAFLSIGSVTGDGSYVKNCSFSKGYNTGIGVFGTDGMTITGNVIHRSVGPSLYIAGSGHEIIENLALVALFRGTYRVPNEPLNSEWTANFELSEASDIVLIGNSAAGGAKAGYHIDGENCMSIPLWRDNVVHSTLHGIHMGYEDGHHCSAFHRFTVYSCYHYGFFSYSPAGVLITDSLFVNNYAATFTAVIGPPSLSHQIGNKSVVIENTRIISSLHPTTGINCTEYSHKPVIAYHPRSHSAIQSTTGGHVGIIMASFVSGSGLFPKFAWSSISTYPAINGQTKLNNVSFCNFATHCSTRREVAIITHPLSEDCQHPLWLNGVLFLSGSNSSKVYIHNPQLSSVNPSDCVDMDCDGLKKILIRDTDGSFLGHQGMSTVISKSEYEWDGDRRHGLGDYRIPLAMLARSDGSKIDPDTLYPSKGIYRGTNGECQWISDWNGYLCPHIDYMMFVIESLDADTEVRRLSPIGIGASGYIDLINGPQDQGWCGGYTCQERISTFYAIVSTGLNYTIGLTATNPQKTNFILLDASDTQSLVIAYIYNNPQRLDVYVGDNYILPTNGYMLNGNLRYSGQGSNYTPSVSDSHGANYYNSTEKKLIITIRGSTPVTVTTTQVIQLSLDLPPVTVNEFFETNLVQNLALLLNIPSSRIRIVNVVSEGGTRKRRQTGGGTVVNVEIGSPPSNGTGSNLTSTGPTAEDNMTYNALLNISESIGIAIQTGQLSNSLGVMVNSAEVREPVPVVSDPTGGIRAVNGTGGPQPGDPGTANLITFAEKQLQEEMMRENVSQSIVLKIPSKLSIVSMPSTGTEGIPLETIEVVMHDTSGNIVPFLGVASFPWILTAYIVPSTSASAFIINNSSSIGNGEAVFETLTFSHAGSYDVDFNISYPSTVNFSTGTSFSIGTRGLYLNVATQPPSIANTTFPLPYNISVQVLDISINTVATNLGWRGRDWFMSASIVLHPKEAVEQVLPNVNIVKGVATFSNVHIHSSGSYVIRFSVFTEPKSSSGELPPPLDSNVIDVKEYSKSRYIVTYNNDYSLVRGREGEFGKNLTSRIQARFPSVIIYNATTWEGSIKAAFFVTSTELSALHDFDSNIKSLATLSFTFDNEALVFVSVVQDPDYPLPPIPTESGESTIGLAIILAIVFSVLGVIIIVGLLVLCIAVYTAKKHKLTATNRVRVRPLIANYEIYANQSTSDEMEYTGTELRLFSTSAKKRNVHGIDYNFDIDNRPSTSDSTQGKRPLSFNAVPNHPHSASRRMY